MEKINGLLNKELDWKIVLGIGGVPLLGLGLTLRYKGLKERLPKVEGWIKEVIGDLAEVKEDADSKGVAYVTDDKKFCYYKKFTKVDLMMFAASSVKFETQIKTIAEHEKAHLLDDRLEEIQRGVHKAINERDYETYRALVLEREQRAWDIGKTFTANPKEYDAMNKRNMKAYEMQLKIDGMNPLWKE